MTDREKIMNDFEHEVNKAHGEGWDFVDLSTDDAKKILVLLKEQEAVSPNIKTNVNGIYYACGNCGEMMFGYKYCPACGRRVKWG